MLTVMKHIHLKDMKNGWFLGNFEPTVVKTAQCEVAVKEYKAGDFEATHYHKIAQEVTVVISGRVEMCGKIFTKGDIISLDPKEQTSFKALTDAVIVAVKIPSVANDKFLA